MTSPKIVVVGSGIVGLATALRLLDHTEGSRITLLEKEGEPALHQSSHNSGVLHSGIYYRPQSAKAELCLRGKAQMEALCEAENIPFERCGKMIVAINAAEQPALEGLLARGKENGVRCELLCADALREREPHCAGHAALHVPDAGIVDYHRVAMRIAERLREAGVDIRGAHRVSSMRESDTEVVVHTDRGAFPADLAIACAGLYSDRLARSCGLETDLQIVPFRGEYYSLRTGARSLCRNLIYPLPDPRFPFLGVHLTRRIDGSVEAGPNAVLAFAREGYRKTDLHPSELAEMLTFPGLWRLAGRHLRAGTGEMIRSWSKRAFLRALRRLVPELQMKDLEVAPAGVRAQALKRDGTLVDDFSFLEGKRSLHILNAPSPAATASLAIAEHIATRALALR